MERQLISHNLYLFNRWKRRLRINSLKLIYFIEEVEMLNFNIEGNSNYGALFSVEVETVFAEILEGIA